MGTCARGHRSFDSAGLCRTLREVEPGLYAYHVGECDELTTDPRAISPVALEGSLSADTLPDPGTHSPGAGGRQGPPAPVSAADDAQAVPAPCDAGERVLAREEANL